MIKTFFKHLLISFLFLSINPVALADKNEVFITILGVVQDAGYPQTGCYKPHCMPGWKDPLLKRGAASIGVVDVKAKKKYIFDATPNFPEQLYRLETIAPSSQYNLDGIFLTHAHIGHYTGLMFLGHEAMGASNVPVYAMPKMSHYLKNNGPWSQLVNYKNIILKPLLDQKKVSLDQISVTAFLVPHRDEYSETVGFRIDGPNKSALYIPDINKWKAWQTDIAELVKTVDYALIDATFYADGELPGRDMSVIQHPFVTESMETFKHLSMQQRNKIWFIHLNHTNPLLNLNSEESKKVLSEGYHISIEGQKLPL